MPKFMLVTDALTQKHILIRADLILSIEDDSELDVRTIHFINCDTTECVSNSLDNIYQELHSMFSER